MGRPVNNVCLVGRLTRDPVVRFEADHQTTTFTLLIAESGREGATFKLFVPCVAWGKAAEAAGVLNAEDLIAVVGKLCWRKQLDKHGQEKSSICVNAREVQLLQAAEVPAV
jgi:single-stranded DNA-binding protein